MSSVGEQRGLNAMYVGLCQSATSLLSGERVSAPDLLTIKPTTVFEGLLDLPQFAGSSGTAVSNPGGAGGNNNASSTLDLRALGFSVTDRQASEYATHLTLEKV